VTAGDGCQHRQLTRTIHFPVPGVFPRLDLITELLSRGSFSPEMPGIYLYFLVYRLGSGRETRKIYSGFLILLKALLWNDVIVSKKAPLQTSVTLTLKPLAGKGKPIG
jgi:hypothetical protein